MIPARAVAMRAVLAPARLAFAGLMLVLGGPALAQAPSPDPRVAAAPAAATAAIPVWGHEIVRTYPHDAGAFTQGLVFVDGELLESTGKEPPSLRRVRLDDGHVLANRSMEGHFPEGLTRIGDRGFSLTWTEGLGHVWDTETLRPLHSFRYTGEGWGLTTDGRRLILSDGTDRLRFLDPQTFEPIGQVRVTFHGEPLTQINELEWVEGEVFANVWQTDLIVRIDPATGAVKGVIDLSNLLPDRSGMDPNDDVLNGIAWDADGRRLFITGKRWPSLFEIRLTGPHREIPAPAAK